MRLDIDRRVEEPVQQRKLQQPGQGPADAERDAAKCLAEADSKADEICSGAEQEAHRHEETVEIRRIEVAALDEEIEMRQRALRTAAAELLQLADGIIDDADIDLRALDGSGSSDADESLTT